MLDTLRKNSRSTLIYVFFGIIIVVFVFQFGPASSGCRSGSLSAKAAEAANVNGRSISMEEYQRAYANTFQQYQQRSGGAFDETMAQQLNLHSIVLEQLVDAELLRQTAKREGLAVTEHELAESLKKIPAFQNKDGYFDHQQYKMTVARAFGRSITDFEAEQRDSLLVQKLAASLSFDAKVSDDEVRAAYVKEKEKLDVDFVRFSPELYTDKVKEPVPSEIDAMLKDKKEQVEKRFGELSHRYDTPEGKKTLPDVERELAAEMLKEERASALAKGAAEEALVKLRAGKKLAELFPARAEGAERTERKVEVESTGPFSPSAEYIPKLGSDAALSAELQTLSEQKRIPEKVAELHGAFIVLELKSREHADMAEFDAKLEELRGAAQVQKSNELFERFLETAKANATIYKNPELLKVNAPLLPTDLGM